MTTPKAILIGFALVAAAVYFSRDVGPARAALGSPDYSIVGDSQGRAWVMDNDKGKIRVCLGGLSGVGCSPWESVEK